MNGRASRGRGGRSRAGERPAAGRAARRAGSPGRQRRNPARHRRHVGRCRAVVATDRGDHAPACSALRASRFVSPAATDGAEHQRRRQRRSASVRRFRRNNCGSAAETCPARSCTKTGRFTFPTSTISIPRSPTGPGCRPRGPPAPARWPARRFGARARRSAPSSCIATGSNLSRPRSLRFSKASPTRPSSPSRTRGCSTRPRRRWSGRPRPPKS